MMPTNLLHRRTRGSRRSLHRSPRRPLLLEPLEARNLLDGGLANVLVNDPALDTTAEDTQSETAIVLGADSKVIVAYNDTGSVSVDPDLFTGWALSTNGGTSFKDKGAVPESPFFDGGDPVLARSSRTGT